jgi:hypothetical protein
MIDTHVNQTQDYMKESIMEQKTVKLKLQAFHSGQYYDVLVDEDDYKTLKQYRWQLWKMNGGLYAKAITRRDGKQRIITMHREILGLERGDGLYGDHINGDTLDNRKANLRAVDNATNVASRRKKRTCEGFVGIYRSYGKYYAITRSTGASRRAFDTAEQAAREYDRIYYEAYGPHCHFNFPHELPGEHDGDK